MLSLEPSECASDTVFNSVRKDPASPSVKTIQNKIVDRQFDVALNKLAELLLADQENLECHNSCLSKTG